MNLDDMKQSWKERNDGLAGQGFDELSAEVVSRCARFEASIIRRDWIETAAAIFVIFFFGIFLQQDGLLPAMKLGAAIILISAIEIVVVLFWTRYRDAQPRLESSLLDYSQAELARLNRQIRLMRKVSFWYSGPILLGCIVFIYGVTIGFAELPRMTAYGFFACISFCFILTGIMVHRINQRAVDRNLLPLRDQITTFLQGLTPTSMEGDDMSDHDDSRITKL